MYVVHGVRGVCFDTRKEGRGRAWARTSCPEPEMTEKTLLLVRIVKRTIRDGWWYYEADKMTQGPGGTQEFASVNHVVPHPPGYYTVPDDLALQVPVGSDSHVHLMDISVPFLRTFFRFCGALGTGQKNPIRAIRRGRSIKDNTRKGRPPV